MANLCYRNWIQRAPKGRDLIFSDFESDIWKWGFGMDGVLKEGIRRVASSRPESTGRSQLDFDSLYSCPNITLKLPSLLLSTLAITTSAIAAPGTEAEQAGQAGSSS